MRQEVTALSFSITDHMQAFVKGVLCVLLWLLLLAPALQAKFHWVKELPLGGAYEIAPRAEFSTKALLDNTFQPALEHYLDDRLGFRALLIRLRNQLAYSVFHESWASRLVVGRNDMLFEQEPIDAWLGIDYVGDDEVRFNSRRLRSVQDSLAQHGVQLVFVIAPSKATFMPENLPDYVRNRPRARTNYKAYAREMAAAGVHVIDFSRAFQNWKRTAPYPLFASGGIHWSIYGGLRAADSVLVYLRKSLGVTPSHFRVKAYELTNTPRDTDDDIARTLNLLLPRPQERLAYPQLELLPAEPTQPKPNMLLVGDSFGFTWFNLHIGDCFSDKTRFWYYNSEVAWPGPEAMPEGKDLGQLKNRAQYLSRDVIVVLFNERNLVAFDKGFSREVYNIFHPYTPADHVLYSRLVQEIRARATWEEAVQDGFERRTNEEATAILDRQRLFGPAVKTPRSLDSAGRE